MDDCDNASHLDDAFIWTALQYNNTIFSKVGLTNHSNCGNNIKTNQSSQQLTRFSCRATLWHLMIEIMIPQLNYISASYRTLLGGRRENRNLALFVSDSAASYFYNTFKPSGSKCGVALTPMLICWMGLLVSEQRCRALTVVMAIIFVTFITIRVGWWDWSHSTRCGMEAIEGGIAKYGILRNSLLFIDAMWFGDFIIITSIQGGGRGAHCEGKMMPKLCWIQL